MGQIPYRDFTCITGPLFPYFGLLCIKCWDTAKSFVVATMLSEILAYPVWMDVGRQLFSGKVTRTAAILYLTSPLPLFTAAFTGQNQIFISLFLGLSLLLLLRGKNLLFGLMLGLSFVTVKWLGVIFAPILLHRSRNPLLWIAGFLFVIAFVLLRFSNAGVNVWQPYGPGSALYSPGNLFSFLSVLGIDWRLPLVGEAMNLVGFSLLGLIVIGFLLRSRKGDGRQAVYLIGGISFCLLFTAKMAYPPNLCASLFAACLAISSRPRFFRRDFLFFSLMGISATMDEEMWAEWMGADNFSRLYTKITAIERLQSWICLINEAILLATCLYFIARIWKLLSETHSISTRGDGASATASHAA